MFKIGDRITIAGNDHVWVVEIINTEDDRVTAKSVFNGKTTVGRLSACKKTFRNPALLLETFTEEWRDNVIQCLKTSGMKYRPISMKHVTKFFVDARKIPAAKKLLSDYYQQEQKV
jgi:hypothetical protein